VFPRQQRLKREDFDAVLRGGRRISSSNFKVATFDTISGNAVVVSKKVARLSVTRHRIKRQVLSVLRALHSPTRSLVVFPQSAVAQMKYQEIKTEITQLLSKIKK